MFDFLMITIDNQNFITIHLNCINLGTIYEIIKSNKFTNKK